MSAYLIAAIDVEDRKTFDHYVKMVEEVIGKDGYKIDAILNDEPVLFDGELPAHRIVLMKFESLEIAKKFYYSENYQKAADVRHASSKTSFSLVVEGDLQRFGGVADNAEAQGEVVTA